MKKVFCFPIMILASLVLHAQEDLVIKGTKKITKELTPQQVVDSLEKHFPNAKSVQYYKAPASVTNNGWTVTTEDNLDASEEVDYYTISFKRDGLKYYGLYDRDGKLLKSKVEQSNADLPEAVKTSLKNLGQKYPGYKVESKTYFKDREYAHSKEYYEVVAKNGDKKKTVYLSPDGTITKVKD